MKIKRCSTRIKFFKLFFSIIRLSVFLLFIIFSPSESFPDGNRIAGSVSKDTLPEAFKVIRNNEELAGQAGMQVNEGDVVAPLKKDMAVKIELNAECGGKVIDKIKRPALIECQNEEDESKFSYIGYFKQKLNEAFGEREPVSTPAMTLRGDGDCLPRPEFRISPLPRNDATILAEAPIAFRFHAFESSCEPALLVITDESGAETLRQRIKISALEIIDAKGKLLPSKEYHWRVERKGKTLSDGGPFILRVLDAGRTKKIRSDLKKITEDKTLSGNDIALAQADYLQMISEGDPDLDLYETSLRILFQYNNSSGSKIYSYLTDNLKVHFDGY